MSLYLKRSIGVFVFALLVSCGGGDDGPPPPPPNAAPTEVSQIVFPTANLLCTDNTVNFQWSASTDPDGDPIIYRLIIANDRDLTDVVENRTVSTNSITITLQRGRAYYWNVTASDNQGNVSAASSTLAFYTSGEGVSNYAPFTAALNAPANGGTVTAGTVTLDWTGSDTDTDDVLSYDLYFGEATDPPLTQSNLSAENFDVTATAGATYYWRVDTIDDSGVKTIGQIWSFTVN
ncbi:hypothetical protein Q2T40_19015 [Winogradskyella maritima]|uniref:Fibronectin type-III domain-containing protein n=1 Tax=Winogradskyella maritima TaxID=1517766 RepID=A0ABV8ADZ7_9FLAO|nr:hypothetical protein [Winogradskyella maritima]